MWLKLQKKAHMEIYENTSSGYFYMIIINKVIYIQCILLIFIRNISYWKVLNDKESFTNGK